jgi:CubicO group peptidase (beta-lactamase class C family)
MSADRSPPVSAPVLSRRFALQAGLGLAAGAAVPGAVAAAASRSPAAAATPKALASVDAMAAALIADGITPGLSLAVSRGGSIVYAKGFGAANLETNTPVTPDCVFRVGSVSKQFVAAALALLAEEGKIGLDDRLSKYLPLFPRAGDVTLRQRITHTSGLGNYTDTTPREAFFRAARTDYGDAELLAAMANTAPLFKFEPGTSWSYSNTAYVLLGLVVTSVTGQPYGEVLRKRLFEPAGMTQTAVDDAGDVVPHRASGYTAKPGAPGVYRNADYISMTFPGAAGALRSTPSDLCRWHAALLGGRIVKPATLTEMLTPARLKSGELPDAPPSPLDPPGGAKKPMKYGFGLFTGEFDGREFVEHGGGIFGFITFFRSFRPQLATVALVVNYDGFDTPAKMQRVSDLRDAAARGVLAMG